MKRQILATQNHAVRLHGKTVHLRGQAFSTKTGWAKRHDSLLFNKDALYTKCTIWIMLFCENLIKNQLLIALFFKYSIDDRP
ncbi:hypothetical protein EXD76_03670 [BEV proteobacterium]|nr:hypothetical protein [Candidatus Symbiopectobacterium sp. Chty_BC]